jgi:N-methylhydantoinase B
VIETLSPVVVKRRELRQDSGGPGACRGGLGQTLEIAVQGERPFMFSGLYERIDHPAPGLHGGKPGAAGLLAANQPEVVLHAKTRVPLPAGTEITLGLPGGGGYGPPWRRDPARVLDDVRDGYVSLARARSDYGVAIDPERMIVLEDETAALRARLRDPRQGAASPVS